MLPGIPIPVNKSNKLKFVKTPLSNTFLLISLSAVAPAKPSISYPTTVPKLITSNTLARPAGLKMFCPKPPKINFPNISPSAPLMMMVAIGV